MIPDAAIAMLACARIGAIHSVVFGGFSSRRPRGTPFDDADSRLVITADEGIRGGRRIPLKANVDAAVAKSRGGDEIKTLVVRRTGGDAPWNRKRDTWLHEALEGVGDSCPPEPMGGGGSSLHSLHVGLDGKPKGVLHTSGGYLVYASLTHEFAFDYRPGEVYWCTADVGWVTGHSYIVYGPLANGATTLMFEGVPTYPDSSRFWRVVRRAFGVGVLHRSDGDSRSDGGWRRVRDSDESLVVADSRHCGRADQSRGVGVVSSGCGRESLSVIDTWWQTETGGILISPLPNETPLKPGSATRPFFGIRPALVDSAGAVLEGEAEGNLCLLESWPGQMRTVYGDHQRFIDTYFSAFPGKYFTGDGARRDADGDYWITGRVDDVLNVSGHRMGTAEIESALVAHASVAEAAVVGVPHEIKGQGIYCYGHADGGTGCGFGS